MTQVWDISTNLSADFISHVTYQKNWKFSDLKYFWSKISKKWLEPSHSPISGILRIDDLKDRGTIRSSFQERQGESGVNEMMQGHLSSKPSESGVSSVFFFFLHRASPVSYLFSLNICFSPVFTDRIWLTGSSNTDTPSGHLWACSQLHIPSPAIWPQFLSLCFWDRKSEPRKQGHLIQTRLPKPHHSAGVPACESADRWGHL